MAQVMNRDVVDMLRAGENWHWAYLAVFSYDLPAAMDKLQCPKFLVSGCRDLSHPRHVHVAKVFPDAPTHENPEGGIYYAETHADEDRKSTRLNSSHANISYAVFCLKKKIISIA